MGKKKLSLKEKGFAKDFIKTKNATEAAVLNYNVKNRKSAALVGCKNLKKPRILREIDRLMEDQKITDPFLMTTLKEGLKANFIASYKGEAELTGIADHNIRHKFLQDALKMKGFLREQVDVRSLNIDVELENMPKEEITKLLKGLLKENESSNIIK